MRIKGRAEEGIKEDVETSGEGRGTLFLPPADYAQADNDPHADTHFSLEDIDVGNLNFITNMCQCRNYGVMVHVVALAVIRRDDGTVELDVGKSNLKLFQWILDRLPRYDKATTSWAAGTIDRDLALRAIDASKQTQATSRRIDVFPPFVAPGASKVKKLKCAVVPAYGSTKTLADCSSSGDGVQIKFVQFGHESGHGHILTAQPPAVLKVSTYALDYDGKERPTPSQSFESGCRSGRPAGRRSLLPHLTSGVPPCRSLHRTTSRASRTPRQSRSSQRYASQ